MILLISKVLPVGVLLSQLLLVLLVLAYIYRAGWGRGVIEFIRRHVVALGLLVSIGAFLGSLFYSVALGFEPCELCIWQRVFLYPQVVLFLTALKTRDERVFSYSWRLTVLATAVSLFQVYAQTWG